MTVQTQWHGVLEIDHERGVVYFHLDRKSDVDRLQVATLLRVCRLPTPIPTDTALDVTYGHGVSWSGTAARTPQEELADLERRVEALEARYDLHEAQTGE
jgi:hypothetical protein